MPLKRLIRLADEVGAVWLNPERIEAVYITTDDELSVLLESGESVEVDDTPENRLRLGLEP